jgi:hypothetical protein
VTGLILITVLMVGFDMAAVLFDVDSRDILGDDHVRRSFD